MKPQFADVMTVDAQLSSRLGTAQLVRFHLPEPVDRVMGEDDQSYRLDLCLTPRPGNARACYPNRWNSQRFERLGNVFMVPPGEAMQARSDGGCQQESLLFNLNTQSVEEWFNEDLEWDSRRLMAGLDIRDANIQGLLLRLVQEARQPGFASEMLVELIGAQLAIELSRYCTDVDTRSVPGGLAPWRLRLIDERLQEVEATPTLAELAELSRLSVRQLTRGFRISRGCSIGDYVANTRIEHAKRLLGTAESVKSIAYTLGFSSPSSFCYAFRRATGDTPGQYRQRFNRTH